MANKRIKDISTTATSAAADDFVVIDGSTQGTRKISAGPLDGNFVDNIVVENGGNKTTYASNFLRSENGSYYIDAYTTGGDILFRTSVASALDTTSMIIDGATGNVSIGGTGAARKLHVTSSGTVAQFESTSTAAYVSLKESGGKHTYLGNSGGDFVVQTADGGYSSKLVIYNGGNVAVPQGNLTVSSGVINIGAADTASAHLNAYENMTFNIDSDGDDSGTRYFAWHTNGSSGSGSELMRLREDGKFAFGHSSPNSEFSIKGDTEFLDNDTGTRIGLLYDNGTEGIFELRDNNVTKVMLRSDGDTYFTGGSVGIKNQVPSNYFGNANALVVGTGTDAHQGITIATNSDGGGHLYFMDGVAAAPGRISYYHTGNNMLFYTNDSERWRITSGGTLLAAASETPIEWNGNGVVSASSHLYIRSTSGGSLYFQTGGAQRWEINSSGNLIGNSGGQILYGDGDVLFPGASANLSWDKSADTLTLQAGAKVGIGAAPGSTTLRVSGGSGQLFKIDDGANPLLVCDATGQVGIGTSSPSSYYAGANNLVVGSNSGSEGITIASGTANQGSIYFADGTAGNQAYRGYVEYSHTNDRMLLGTAGSTRLQIDSDGNVAIGHGAFGAKVDIATATDTAGIFIRDNSDSSITHQIYNASGNGNLAIYADGGVNTVNINSAGDTFFNGGSIGIGTNSPGSYNSSANNLVVGSGSGNEGLTIASGSSDFGIIYFADGTTGDEQYRGTISYHHGSDELSFGTAAATRWKIDNAGNLVANGSYDILMPDNAGAALEIKEGANPYLRFITTNGGEKIEVYKNTIHSANIVMGANLGIDFSGTSDGSGNMSSEVLDDYEEGTWTPVFGVTSGSFTTMTMDVLSARYVKIGHLVNFICYIRTNDVNTTGTGGQLTITGLPYANAGSNNFAPCSVGYAQDWATAPAAGYVVQGGSFIYLTRRVTSITGDLTEMVAGDMTTGAVASENQLMISGSYYSF